MLKGAMRTITGKIGKIAPQKFSVNIRTATIGIRGTNFSIVVKEDGSYKAYCTYGEISVAANNQEYMIKQDFVLSSSPNTSPIIKEFTMQDLEDMKSENFTTNSNKKPLNSTKTNNITKNEENNEQLNVTVTDESALIVNDITNNASDSIQNKKITDDLSQLTDSSIIEAYSMNNASYTGTYQTTSNSTLGTLSDTGTASLTIDFGADKADLVLDNIAYFSQNAPGPSSNSFTMSVGYPSAGGATAEFYGPTGNIVKGGFNYLPTADPQFEAVGTYEVTSSQTLQ